MSEHDDAPDFLGELTEEFGAGDPDSRRNVVEAYWRQIADRLDTPEEELLSIKELAAELGVDLRTPDDRLRAEGLRGASPEEFERRFGHLPKDGEG